MITHEQFIEWAKVLECKKFLKTAAEFWTHEDALAALAIFKEQFPKSDFRLITPTWVQCVID